MATAPTQNDGAGGSLTVDGDTTPAAALLKWDLTSIPHSSIVRSVTLTLNVTNTSPASFQLYEALRGWSEAEVTWTAASAASAWEAPGARGSSDRSLTDLGQLGAAYGKYVLNLSGHSHNYERTTRQSGVVHVVVGTGGAPLLQMPDSTCGWSICPAPAWSAKRLFHHASLRLRFTATGIEGKLLCGPPQPALDDVSCTLGSTLDSFAIGTP